MVALAHLVTLVLAQAATPLTLRKATVPILTQLPLLRVPRSGRARLERPQLPLATKLARPMVWTAGRALMCGMAVLTTRVNQTKHLMPHLRVTRRRMLLPRLALTQVQRAMAAAMGCGRRSSRCYRAR
jgi:hypothetical protein